MMADGSRCDPEVEDMEAGVARQCSRNRCLARWTVWIPHRGRGGGAGRANSKEGLGHGPNPSFCALHASSSSALSSCRLVRPEQVEEASQEKIEESVDHGAALSQLGRLRRPGCAIEFLYR